MCVIVRERVCDSERTCVYVCVYMMHACAVFTLVVPVTARAGVLPTYIAKACIIILHIAQPFPGIPKYGVLHLKYCQSIQHNTIIRSCSFCCKVLGMDVWSITQYSQIK